MDKRKQASGDFYLANDCFLKLWPFFFLFYIVVILNFLLESNFKDLNPKLNLDYLYIFTYKEAYSVYFLSEILININKTISFTFV